jgi:predicted N-acetyltransferase YhbS
MEIRRLKKEDYDELLSMLNKSFAAVRNRPVDFLRGQPKMWVRDDEHMARHLGLFEDGKLCSVVGIYPLPLRVGDTLLRFATTGNVATLPEYAGRGYFTKLFSMAMEEAEREGYDALRLGGQKQRYGRFGFEDLGVLYQALFSEKNRAAFPKETYTDVTFERLTRESYEDLAYVRNLSAKSPCYVERYGTERERDVYLVLHSKYSEAYVAKRGGKPIGYLSASDGGENVGEIRGEDTDAFFSVACAWQARVGKTIRIPMAPWENEVLSHMARIAEGVQILSPSKFKLLHPDRVIDAFLKLKQRLAPLPEGELCMEIRGFGAMCLSVKSGAAECRCVQGHQAELCLSPADAARLVFGHLPAALIAQLPPYAAAWFPLPLSWNFMDFV